MENKDLDWVIDVNPIIYFENLEFKPHPAFWHSEKGAVQATGHFPINGKWYSVVGGAIGLYGDGVNTFEVWGDDMADPIGYLNKEEVNEWLIEMQSK
jgi:hypothetical protein